MSNRPLKYSRAVFFILVFISLYAVICGILISKSRDSNKTVPNKIMLSIYATKKIYCTNDPIELKILFENVSDQDILMIDPETWQISSLFYYIKDASGHKICAEPRKIRNVFADPDIKLVLLKSGAKIEFCYPDIKSQYFDEYQYKMDKEGLYYVSASYNPGRVFRTKKGMISYRGKITSNEIEIQLKKCTG